LLLLLAFLLSTQLFYCELNGIHSGSIGMRTVTNLELLAATTRTGLISSYFTFLFRAVGVNLVSDTLLFGRLWYGGAEAVTNAVGYAKLFSRSHHAVIRVYDAVGNVIERHEHKGDFKEW
jgi:hypothetical protein